MTDVVAPTVAALRRTFESGRTRPVAWRRAQLEALGRLLVERESALLDALASDLGKSAVEAWATELGLVRAECAHARRRVARWARPDRVAPSLLQLPGTARVEPSPRGVILILAPWNYPLNLTLAPLVGALAAGNCVALKPSERAPRTSEVLARTLPEFVDADAVRVVEGDARTAAALVDAPFDLVFFTGGATVGREVAVAAARRLVPVVLELGGKSPCVVLDDADLETAARRVAWGKVVNAGQTCVAPDHVLVARGREAELVDRLAAAVAALLGEDPAASPDYGRIVDARHHARLVRFLGDGEAACGGGHDEAALHIDPTVLTNVAPDAPVTREEIFGPILPVLPVDGEEEAIARVAAAPAPLALYVFTRSAAAARRVLDRTASGGAAVNDVLLHLANPRLPFGGVGGSGYGAYHGRAGFDAFSHRRSVLARGTRIDPAVRYPPYGRWKRWWIERLIR